MKIKTKKQLNLPQLIEWGFENDVKNEYFLTHDSEGNTSEVHFDITGLPKFSSMVDKTDTFTVEVEEEITEDTFFKHLIKVTEDGRHYSVDSLEVRDLIYLSTEEIHAYIDGEYKLIWTHEKGLVE